MASGFSDYLRNALLKDFAGVAAYAKPATLYFTLHAAAWNPSGMASEFASGNWARIAVTRDNTKFGVTTNVMSLLADAAGVELNAAQQGSNPALAWACYDALTGGNLLFGGDLPAGDQKAYAANDQWVVKGTTTTITLT